MSINIINLIRKLILLTTIFFISSFIILLFNFYFIGLTYIIIYIGAITILFLFVIMMIEINSFSPIVRPINQTTIIGILVLLF
eukprot:jgi/Hompol1/5057/HPOL_004122-RA